MSDENNINGNDRDAETESARILDEIQARLDANDLTQAEMQKLMLRFEFQLAQMRRETAAANKRITEHLRYLTDLVGVLADKSFEYDNRLRRAGAMLAGSETLTNTDE